MTTDKTDTFIKKARKVHGNRYGYCEVDYKLAKLKVTIICRRHGAFEQQPTNHLSGKGCQECGRELQVRNNKQGHSESFIKDARKVHGNRYGYDEFVYKLATANIKIFCYKHNVVFEQTPRSHLKGSGCPQCGYELRGNKLRSNTETFIDKARKVHSDRYGYDEVVYKKSSSKVKILCRHHNSIFEQTPSAHLMGAGCAACGFELIADIFRKTNETFIKEAIAVHGDKYGYEHVDYKANNLKVKIYCRRHDAVFEQIPSAHLWGSACPQCSNEIYGGFFRSTEAVKDYYAGQRITVYLVKLTGVESGEFFYKIGLTARNLVYRRPGGGIYKWEKAQIIKNIDKKNAVLFEQYLHNDHPYLKEKKFEPKYRFKGYTECYHSLDDWDMASAFDEFCQSRHKGNLQLTNPEPGADDKTAC